MAHYVKENACPFDGNDVHAVTLPETGGLPSRWHCPGCGNEWFIGSTDLTESNAIDQTESE